MISRIFAFRFFKELAKDYTGDKPANMSPKGYPSDIRPSQSKYSLEKLK